jgi:hypothetical protein
VPPNPQEEVRAFRAATASVLMSAASLQIGPGRMLLRVLRWLVRQDVRVPPQAPGRGEVAPWRRILVVVLRARRREVTSPVRLGWMQSNVDQSTSKQRSEPRNVIRLGNHERRAVPRNSRSVVELSPLVDP